MSVRWWPNKQPGQNILMEKSGRLFFPSVWPQPSQPGGSGQVGATVGKVDGHPSVLRLLEPSEHNRDCTAREHRWEDTAAVRTCGADRWKCAGTARVLTGGPSSEVKSDWS